MRGYRVKRKDYSDYRYIKPLGIPRGSFAELLTRAYFGPYIYGLIPIPKSRAAQNCFPFLS